MGLILRPLGSVAVLCALAGCTSIADKRAPEKIAAIEIGKSSKADVIDILGLPNESSKETLENGRGVECWVYYRWADRSTAIISGPYGGSFTASTVRRGKERKDHAATLIFSDAGIVIEVQSPPKENP